MTELAGRPRRYGRPAYGKARHTRDKIRDHLRLYLAGPLFTEAERAFNLVLTQALEAEGHQVYLPQRDTSPAQTPDRTTTIFYANLAALRKADAVVAVCDGSQVDDGTAWEIGYAYGKNIHIFGLRTDVRIVQRADESINLMVLESLSELSPTIEQLVHTLRYAERP